MAISCPVDFDTQKLRSEVSKIYSRVATEPSGDFHFHRGPEYASEFLGYDAAELAALPADCTASFAGIANPIAIGPISAGDLVLDIGCGAGMDLLLAARRTGPTGRAIGIDMTEAMRECARASAAAAGLAYPQCEGPRPFDQGVILRYLGHVVSLSCTDKKVLTAWNQVTNMQRPLSALFAPSIAGRVIRRALTGGRSSNPQRA